MILKPQEGFQEQFLSSSADIVFGGGAAGAGKSFALLLESVRHVHVKGFGAVIFRRTREQVRQQGGLWDTCKEIYPIAGGELKESKLLAQFSNSVYIKFSFLEYHKHIQNWQGSQIPFIGFDELTHFTWEMFNGLMARNRSTCGVKPYIRATCNPDPDSWVRDFIDWWIDEDGYIIKDRSGKIRYFTVDADVPVWGDKKQEVIDKCPHKFDEIIKMGKNPENLVKSFTFIDGDIYGNKKLLDNDPNYLASLLALTDTEQKRLLKGNWNVKVDGLILAEHGKVEDMYTNVAPMTGNKGISIDHARFGRDLCVIISWDGWRTLRIDVLTKSDGNDIADVVKNKHQKPFRIGNSDVITDQDGINVKDMLIGSKLFVGQQAPKTSQGKKVYKNFKTQCSYHLCEKVINENLIHINLDEVYVDGVRTKTVRIKKKEYNIKALISRQIRTIRKADLDGDGKLTVESKEQQKVHLNGMSPDFSDNFVIRASQMIRPKIRAIKAKN